MLVPVTKLANNNTIIMQEFQDNMIENISPLWLMDLIMDRQNLIFTTSPVRKLEGI